MVATYKIDGLRLDAAKHLSGYLAEFQNAGMWFLIDCLVLSTYLTFAAGGIHTIGEIYTGDPADACSYQGPNAISGVMNFPA